MNAHVQPEAADDLTVSELMRLVNEAPPARKSFIRHQCELMDAGEPCIFDGGLSAKEIWAVYDGWLAERGLSE